MTLLARVSDSWFFLKVEIDASCQCGVSADDDRIVNGEEAKVKKTRIIKGLISILIPIPPNDDERTEMSRLVVSFDILEVLTVNHFLLRLILFSLRSSHPRIFDSDSFCSQ